MNKDKALKLALEALEADALDMVDDGNGNLIFRKERAITAIQEALAQPEQETLEFIEAFANLAHAAGAAAERERLLAGVEMPEPEVLGYDERWEVCGDEEILGYTADQLRETVAAAVAKKSKELEENIAHEREGYKTAQGQ